ncbi:alanine or glycine:cation symporter, AGCS family [Prosthecobacter debontii]|uniref:Alanine or glycine:cation symporter, AGCS family n=1 Tax=Prosthecobacter debontii TaxID=48467 RepID=A0A1T4Z2X5_9BACT|nr:sodium:alanine symporter family protein [Prosthecobacter debontii]SKB08399.1 alanine or glycine:cation symporter, AGCS family [Prosthecobacter debontii]
MDISKIAADFAGFVWGTPLIVLLFGTHLFLTFRTGFIQRYLGRGIKLSITKDDTSAGDVSQFGALMTALAATIGTGNIVGVAGAVAAGGPGAVLWMWLTGVFGIATKYGEALLAVKYRVQMPNGSYAGGPMYALERGLNMKWLGIIFAIFTCIAGFGIGCMSQANSVVGHLQTLLPAVNKETIAWTAGGLMTVLTAAVILGGVKSIAKVCSVLVPFMAILYVIGCACILIKNFSVIPETVSLIFSSAFTGQAAIGGFIGAGMKEAMRYGIARGLFSNESGLGSAPIVAAAAQTKTPVRQALVSSTGTFWDTVVVCAMTGLVIVSSGHWKEGLSKVELTQAAFGELHTYGPYILMFGLITFVFSTILGWSYYGEKAAEYLLGTRAVLPYRLLWVAAVLVGSVMPLGFVWDFSDAFNGLMAIPNLIALIALSGVIAAETRASKNDLIGKD